MLERICCTLACKYNSLIIRNDRKVIKKNLKKACEAIERVKNDNIAETGSNQYGASHRGPC